MSQSIADRLKAAGIELIEPPKPVAAYVGFVRHGDLVFVSGQVPIAGGEVAYKGILGRDVTVEEGVAAARLCAINILCQINQACGGNLEKVRRCIKLSGFVAATPDFTGHPQVINGASELMGEILGERGQHARAAVGMASLPLGVPVEIEAIFSIND